MTPPRTEPTLDSRQRLLVAAVEVFADKGFQGAGIREIAQRAQANSALVQYHFGGKEGLYRAALAFLFDHPDSAVPRLPAPPEPGSPDCRAKAIAHLRLYISTFLSELFEGKHCPEGGVGFQQAAHLFWHRELMDPAPDRLPLILEHIRPYVEHVRGCVRALRPDLDAEGVLLMICSIDAQVVFHHMHHTTISAIRGRPYGTEDLDALADHITTFSLRGLGIPEAFPAQGV